MRYVDGLIYVDAERFLVFRLDRRTEVPTWMGSPVILEREAFVGNYKRVGAVMFPHTLEVRQSGLDSTMTVERVELNPGIGDDRFAMPQVSR